jgi:DNA-directed RNA polymerase specialized sigma24 family protein
MLKTILPGLFLAARRLVPMIDRLAIEQAVLMLPTGCRSAFILHDIEGNGAR